MNTFRIDGLNKLNSLKIGINSFTKNKNNLYDQSYDISKSFHILNCNELISIDIGENSFSDFGGEFELKNLPKLQYINIGSIGDYDYYDYYDFSSNFVSSSFIIRGIYIHFYIHSFL